MKNLMLAAATATALLATPAAFATHSAPPPPKEATASEEQTPTAAGPAKHMAGFIVCMKQAGFTGGEHFMARLTGGTIVGEEIIGGTGYETKVRESIKRTPILLGKYNDCRTANHLPPV